MTIRFVEYEELAPGKIGTTLWLEDGAMIERQVKWFIRKMDPKVDGPKHADRGETHMLIVEIFMYKLKNGDWGEKSTTHLRMNTQELLGLAADIQAKVP
jgi:hypothetical protein